MYSGPILMTTESKGQVKRSVWAIYNIDLLTGDTLIHSQYKHDQFTCIAQAGVKIREREREKKNKNTGLTDKNWTS